MLARLCKAILNGSSNAGRRDSARLPILDEGDAAVKTAVGCLVTPVNRVNRELNVERSTSHINAVLVTVTGYLTRLGLLLRIPLFNFPVSPQLFFLLTMVLGRLAHYAIDAILLSTVVAGVKRSTGFAYVQSHLLRPPRGTSHLHLSWTCSPNTETISNPTIRSFTEQYLGFGETLFNVLQGTVVTSPYFKRSEQRQ